MQRIMYTKIHKNYLREPNPVFKKIVIQLLLVISCVLVSYGFVGGSQHTFDVVKSSYLSNKAIQLLLSPEAGKACRA